MKKALKSTLGSRHVDIEEFRTALLFAQGTVNSRPLSAASDDCRDPNPLTPAHLLIGRPIQFLPDNLTRDNLNDQVTEKWRAKARLFSELWTRFLKEYFTALQGRPKWTMTSPEPKLGEVVYFMKKDSSRLLWPLARIVQTHTGRDGKIRSCTLKYVQVLPGDVDKRDLTRIKTTVKTFRRDLRHIVRLECTQ
jgi:hypothetical protein